MKKRMGMGGPQESVAGQMMKGYAAMEKKDKADDAKDRKMGIKENSPRDMALDKKAGVPENDAPKKKGGVPPQFMPGYKKKGM